MIKIDRVSFSYEEDRELLKDLSLDINDGEKIAIIGKNGSGKTTFTKLINSLLYKSSGEIFVDDIELNDDNLYDIRKLVSMVFQNPENQIISSIVENDVAFSLENLSYPHDIIKKRVDWALEKVGLIDKRYHDCSSLSGGQKQLLAIASCLALQSKYIIFDEITSMLDALSRKNVMNLINQLNKEHNISIIYITQDMDELIHFDRVVVFNKGKIIYDGKRSDLFKSKILDDLEFKKPTMLKFYEDLKINSIDVKEHKDIYDSYFKEFVV